MTEPPIDVNAISLIMMVTSMRDECAAFVIALHGDHTARIRNHMFRNRDGFLRAFESYSSPKTQSKALFAWNEGRHREAEKGLHADARFIFQEEAARLRSEGWISGAPDQDHGWSVQVFTRPA